MCFYINMTEENNNTQTLENKIEQQEEKLDLTYYGVRKKLDCMSPYQVRKMINIPVTFRELELILSHKYLISKNKSEAAMDEAVMGGATLDEASGIIVEPLSMRESVCSYFINEIEEFCRKIQMREFNLFQAEKYKECMEEYKKRNKKEPSMRTRLNWVAKNGPILRADFESPESNSFHVLNKELTNEHGLHTKFCTEMADYLNKIDCDILVSKETSDGKSVTRHHDCVVYGKKFINIERFNKEKCISKLRGLNAKAGDFLVFLFYSKPNPNEMSSINVPHKIARLIVEDMIEHGYCYKFN